MNPFLQELPREESVAMKVEDMVNFFEQMDAYKTNGSRIRSPSGRLIGSPALVVSNTEESRALVSVSKTQTATPTLVSVKSSRENMSATESTMQKVQPFSDCEVSPRSTSMDGSSLNKDVAMAKIKKEKILSLIKAWEENKKKRSRNQYDKKMAKLDAWEAAKIARAEATLRTSEEKLENKRAAFVEKTKNKIAHVHKVAEEKRTVTEAQYGREVVRTEEIASKCRASGSRPWRFCICS